MARLKVFISYRRDDIHGVAQGIVGRIYDRLEDHYGDGNVFMDIDNIPPGVNFVEYLDSWVSQADVLLTVIGPQWGQLLQARRADPRDFVRIEIEAALSRGIPVVPLLVRGARMPGPEILTGGLARMAEHQAFVVDDGRDFKHHVGRLVKDLDTHYKPRKPGPKAQPAPPQPATVSESKVAAKPKPVSKVPRDHTATFIAVGLAVVAVVAGLFWPRGGSSPDPSDRTDRTDLVAPTPAPTPPQLITNNKQPFTNSLGMQFVPVPGTNILMSIWETRVQDYAAFAAANPGVDSKWKDVEYGGNKQGPDHPVVNVSWEDAQAFCKWLTKKEDKTYRLPTDHEWSLAVGIGDQEDPKASPADKDRKIRDVHPWGTQWPPPKGAGNYGFIPDYSDEHPFTSPVGSYNPNKFGIYDLGGNAYEWCEDQYEPSSSRVLRGASWFDDFLVSMLSSERYDFGVPTNRDVSVGFRVVVEGAVED